MGKGVCKPATAGSAKFACPRCNKKPIVGQPRYFQNLAPANEPEKWISCPDYDCFVAQGGTLENVAPVNQTQLGGENQQNSEPISPTQDRLLAMLTLRESALKMALKSLDEAEAYLRKKFSVPDNQPIGTPTDYLIFIESTQKSLLNAVR